MIISYVEMQCAEHWLKKTSAFQWGATVVVRGCASRRLVGLVANGTGICSARVEDIRQGGPYDTVHVGNTCLCLS